MDYLLAVDLGGTKIASALVGDGDRLLVSEQRPTEADQGVEHVIANLLASIESVLGREGITVDQVAALGIAAPGPLNPETGVICFAPNLCWHQVNLRKELERKLGIPVWVENDANLAALGEYLYGAGRGVEDLVYITVSTGIGGGLILGGRIYDGAYGGAGEFGHMIVCHHAICSCGNRGCLESVASGKAIARSARELVAKGRGRQILAQAGGDPGRIDGRAVTLAAQAGDDEARQILIIAGRYLGQAIASTANLLNPALFVVGGGVALGAGELLLGPAVEEARKRTYPTFKDSLRIVPAALGPQGGMIGAAAYARGQMPAGQTDCPTH